MAIKGVGKSCRGWGDYLHRGERRAFKKRKKRKGTRERKRIVKRKG